MTTEEWAKDFKSYINALDMPRDDYKGIMEYIDDAVSMLKEQTEIVRCKDCKYYDHFNGCMSWHDVNSNNDNWFCADGERKEGR